MRRSALGLVAMMLGILLWPAVAWAQQAEAPYGESTETAVEEPDDGPTDEPADEPDEPDETDEAAKAERATTAEAELPPGRPELESDFSNYLHFALIGQFDIADKYARTLLANAHLNPLSPAGAAELINLTDRYRDSIDILLMVIHNTSIAENARKLMGLIRQAHRMERRQPQRINDSIRMLAGSPTEQATAMERLMDAGEHAVPWLLLALTDPERKELRPYVLRALPKLGRRAVNPLLAALAAPDPVLQRYVVEVLGRIGYPQSLPYLKRLAEDSAANESVRQAAVAAMGMLVVEDRSILARPTARLFAELAEQYYGEHDSLSADPRDELASVWMMGPDMVEAVEVPRTIFPQVMCMRVCEQALTMDKTQPGVVALWLAANFRREARLGLDVREEAVVRTADLTRPPDFPRSVYFARAAGPPHCLAVLQRAVKDRDIDVALGAIAALDRNAGPAAMVSYADPAGTSLASALQFPDLLVRVRAALALANAQPPQPFRGSDEVVPILASALSLRGEKFYMLVEGDEHVRRSVAEGLGRGGATVIAEARLEAALARAHREVTHLDGVFLASDMQHPPVGEALAVLNRDLRFALSPVVVYVKEGQAALAEKLPEIDPRAGWVLVVARDGAIEPAFAELLLKRHTEIAPRYGFRLVDEQTGTALALEAVRAMLALVRGRNPVLDVRVAARALEGVLNHPNEALPPLALQVLGGLDLDAAQQAVAHVALDASAGKSLRLTALAALADSARQFGSRLDAAASTGLTELAFRSSDLEIRTAASAALGAINLRGQLAADIILQGR